MDEGQALALIGRLPMRQHGNGLGDFAPQAEDQARVFAVAELAHIERQLEILLGRHPRDGGLDQQGALRGLGVGLLAVRLRRALEWQFEARCIEQHQRQVKLGLILLECTGGDVAEMDRRQRRLRAHAVVDEEQHEAGQHALVDLLEVDLNIAVARLLAGLQPELGIVFGEHATQRQRPVADEAQHREVDIRVEELEVARHELDGF